MKLMDIGGIEDQDVERPQPVVEAVAALVLKFQARTGVWSRQSVSRSLVTTRLAMVVADPV
jgi:hypothetical protein